MQRAQRAIDNPALNIAVDAANTLGQPLVVYFAPVPFYPRANLRHYRFLNEGIVEIASELARKNIGFVLRSFPDHSLLRFCEEVRPALVIGDENPLREPELWRKKAANNLKFPFWTVDADVIIPSRFLRKAEYAARTIRPKLMAQLETFLVTPRNPVARATWKRPKSMHSLPVGADVTEGWSLDRSVSPISSWHGGTAAAFRILRDFIDHKLPAYASGRNQPQVDHTSRLSPYLHFGYISPVTVALAVYKSEAPQAAKAAFLDQILIWRELAVNFVRFNSNYDNFECAEPWAHRTLAKHARDPRPTLYSERRLEYSETHDRLWNAAQTQMVANGWMHNYMRMYWAKKILEWSASPAEAYQIAVHLNDKYELDGRDPNGYAGIAWSIVGKFDRPWFERPIFGQIRYMSAASTGKKFDSEKYIEQNLSTNSGG